MHFIRKIKLAIWKWQYWKAYKKTVQHYNEGQSLQCLEQSLKYSYSANDLGIYDAIRFLADFHGADYDNTREC